MVKIANGTPGRLNRESILYYHIRTGGQGTGLVGMSLEAFKTLMPRMPITFTYHDRTEAQAIAARGPVTDGTRVRTVASQRKMRDGLGRGLQLDPVRNLAGLETEHVGIWPPARTDNGALDGWQHRTDKPSLVRCPGRTVGSTRREGRDRVTPHVLFRTQRGGRDGVWLDRRGSRIWRLLARFCDIRPRIPVNGRIAWDGVALAHQHTPDTRSCRRARSDVGRAVSAGHDGIISVPQQGPKCLGGRGTRTGLCRPGGSGQKRKRRLGTGALACGHDRKS